MDDSKTEIVDIDEKTLSDANLENNAINTLEALELAWKVSCNLAKSNIIPQTYQNNPSNCLVALEISSRVRLSPFMVMQDLYIVNGTPSWSGKMVIALTNSSGKFAKPLDFKVEGEGMDMCCISYTFDHDGNIKESPKVTMQMAKDEGWLEKKGSKWKTMPELMIRYRSASFFAKLHCPEVLSGLQTSDELRDIKQVKQIEKAKNIFEEDGDISE